jgi:hypothetical protein
MAEHDRMSRRIGEIPSRFENLPVGGPDIELVHRDENQIAAAVRIANPAITEARMR